MDTEAAVEAPCKYTDTLIVKKSDVNQQRCVNRSKKRHVTKRFTKNEAHERLLFISPVKPLSSTARENNVTHRKRGERQSKGVRETDGFKRVYLLIWLHLRVSDSSNLKAEALTVVKPLYQSSSGQSC